MSVEAGVSGGVEKISHWLCETQTRRSSALCGRMILIVPASWKILVLFSHIILFSNLFYDVHCFNLWIPILNRQKIAFSECLHSTFKNFILELFDLLACLKDLVFIKYSNRHVQIKKCKNCAFLQIIGKSTTQLSFELVIILWSVILTTKVLKSWRFWYIFL